MSVIYINAIQVEDCGNGLFAIHLPSRELSKEERAFMAKMFPNLGDRAYQVLEQEALLTALADQEQIITKEEPLNGGPSSTYSQPKPAPKKSKPVVQSTDYNGWQNMQLRLKNLPVVTMECDCEDSGALYYDVTASDIAGKLRELGFTSIKCDHISMTPLSSIREANTLTNVTVCIPEKFSQDIQVLVVPKVTVK